MPENSGNTALNILFICTGNCSRSVMAEALMKQLARESGLNWHIHSAGTHAKPGLPPTENTILVLKERGFAVSPEDFQAKPCAPELIDSADLILVMESKHRKMIIQQYPGTREKIRLLPDFCPEMGPWIRETGIPDPLGRNMSFYLNVYGLVEQACLNLIRQMRDYASTHQSLPM